jgi:hypothetical protein
MGRVDAKDRHAALVSEDCSNGVMWKAAPQQGTRLLDDFAVPGVEEEPEPPGARELNDVAITEIET